MKTTKWEQQFILVQCKLYPVEKLRSGVFVTQNIIRFAGLQNVRFYVQGLNLLTFDSLDDVDMDPETKEGSGDWYPIQRVYNFGVEITY